MLLRAQIFAARSSRQRDLRKTGSRPSRFMRAPRRADLIEGFVHLGDDMEAVKHVQCLGAFHRAVYQVTNGEQVET